MIRNHDNINLKNNEITYRIGAQEQLCKAVRYYGTRIIDGDVKKLVVKICQRLRKRENLDKIRIIEGLDFGTNNLLFENTKIIVQLNQFDKPLINENGPQFHYEMLIQIKNNSNTLKENKKIAEKFFKKSIEVYTEELLDKRNETGRTTIYIWDDGFWDTLEKGISRSISTIYLDGKENEIKNIITTFLSKEEETKYAKFGVPWKLNLLFHGYPGTGKTSLVYSIASELNMGVALLSFTRKMEDTDLMRALRRLPDDTILVIEDIDALFESRKKNDENKNNITFSALLNTLDGIAHSHGQIIIMTTNHPLILDNALKRPGRVDYSFEFGYANKNQIQKMFNTFIPNQKELFNDFYNEIKHLKITTAILQKFLFGNMKHKSIINQISELEQLCNENSYDIKNNLYS